MKRRLTALMFVFALLLSSGIIFAQTNGSSGELDSATFLYQGLTFEEFARTDVFLEASANFVDNLGFSQEFTNNYFRSQEYLNNLIERYGVDEDGNFLFPDYISGIHIDDNGILVVSIANVSTTLSQTTHFDALATSVNAEEAVIRNVQFSHSELDEVKWYIDAIAQRRMNSSLPAGLTMIFINNAQNRVVVGLEDVSEESIRYFTDNFIDSPMIIFEQMGRSTTAAAPLPVQ